jgi:hypothetical protein
VSIQEEIEQHKIESCVKVDTVQCRSTTLLPLVTDPDTRFDPDAQRRLALKIYESQVRTLDNKPKDREAAISQETKLHNLGFVEYLENLPSSEQEEILQNVNYVIPWRIVFSENSVSTPCRIVYDASVKDKSK